MLATPWGCGWTEAAEDLTADFVAQRMSRQLPDEATGWRTLCQLNAVWLSWYCHLRGADVQSSKQIGEVGS